MGLNVFGVPDIVVSIYNSANQVIATGAATTALSFDTEIIDTADLFDAAVNANEIQITTAGTYFVAAHIHWTANATSWRNMQITVNGAVMEIADARIAPAATTTPKQSVSGLLYLNDGDLVGIKVSQLSGGNLNVVTPSNNDSQLQLFLVSLAQP